MKRLFIIFFIGLCQASRKCQKVETLDENPTFFANIQPIYINLMPKSPETTLIDNICVTYFALPDNPDIYTVYVAQVYCDGSFSITTFAEGPVSKGVNHKANPSIIVRDHHISYVGCDTNVVYRCSVFGEPFDPFVYGGTTNCRPLGLSCLKKFQEIVRERNLPETDFYVFPMKLPSRCVTQQLCLVPPNPFYNQLGGYGGAYLV